MKIFCVLFSQFGKVAYLLASESTIKREFGAFDKITDASPKYVLSLDRIDMGHNGIEYLNIVDFLLHKVDLHLTLSLSTGRREQAV